MGINVFPTFCYDIPFPEPLMHVFKVLEHVYLLLRLAFFYVGLFDPTNNQPSADHDHVDGLGLVHLQSPPTPPITTYLIKKTLPIVEFARFVNRSGSRSDDDKPVCIICFGCLEEHHGIRELSNCSHVFHCGCLDQWVDKGHISCPICRTNLLPRGYGRKGGKPSWAPERISHLFW